MRRAPAFHGDKAELWVIERHGYTGFAVPKADDEDALLALRHLEAFRRRTREWDDDELGFDHVNALVDAAIDDLGVDHACDLFFTAEREYWTRRNRAAKWAGDRFGIEAVYQLGAFMPLLALRCVFLPKIEWCGFLGFSSFQEFRLVRTSALDVVDGSPLLLFVDPSTLMNIRSDVGRGADDGGHDENCAHGSGVSTGAATVGLWWWWWR